MAGSVMQSAHIVALKPLELCFAPSKSFARKSATLKKVPVAAAALRTQQGGGGSGWEEGSSAAEAVYVPRICTLKEFSDGVSSFEVAGSKESDDRSVAELLLACVEASAQTADFETLSGRLAMVGFAAALSIEFVTGNSIFRGLDVASLAKVLGLCLLAAGAAAGFAIGWRSKKHVSDTLASGCKSLMDSAVDSMIEGLFFDDKTDLMSLKSSVEKTGN